ncbi:Outer membrane lipoprotein-sorting protein [Flexibacter flexilis DSM 6793]|uniref:Outer membrane lipoprotein-sorting protein n=1 Tax=Flexibacter flexilis DSM 6793 TaxID=927664 RepID=A0A1I1KJC6_9BACT|nr:outer membrane lipoprotein carrier protein LolA [Flexibacter flexilis]SFC58778.1 Outer membrane lipoprotein-sorting protein [Flexibacter flexilis DSM 6793]
MKKIVAFVVLLAGINCQTAWAQLQAKQDPLAQKILDVMGKKYKTLQSYKATYSQTFQANDGKTLDEQKGEILVKGKKFNLKLNNQVLVCDGNTLWSYVRDAKELNISDYQPEEGEITPTNIYTMYQNGFKYMMIGEVKDKGKVFQVVDLEPDDRNKEILKVRLYVGKADQILHKWIIYERGTNNRQVFEITKFTANAAAPESSFSFDKKVYPVKTQTDLR